MDLRVFLVHLLSKLVDEMMNYNTSLLDNRDQGDQEFCHQYIDVCEHNMGLRNEITCLQDQQNHELEELRQKEKEAMRLNNKLKTEDWYMREQVERNTKKELRIKSADYAAKIKEKRRKQRDCHDLEEDIEHMQKLLNDYNNDKRVRERQMSATVTHLLEANHHGRGRRASMADLWGRQKSDRDRRPRRASDIPRRSNDASDLYVHENSESDEKDDRSPGDNRNRSASPRDLSDSPPVLAHSDKDRRGSASPKAYVTRGGSQSPPRRKHESPPRRRSMSPPRQRSHSPVVRPETAGKTDRGDRVTPGRF